MHAGLTEGQKVRVRVTPLRFNSDWDYRFMGKEGTIARVPTGEFTCYGVRIGNLVIGFKERELEAVSG